MRADPNNPKTAEQRIYARELGHIGARPKTVRFNGGGFPPGYALLGAEVHVYKAGVEIDTNAAPKRFGISADDAFQVEIADYVGGHRGATLPATAVSGVQVRRAASTASGTYYVRVARNGLPLAAYTDESCAERVSDSELTSYLTSMRFYPALKSGRPVDSVIAVRL